MRFELRKLIFRRECIILLAVFVGYAVFFAVRIKPTSSMLEESVGQYEQHMQEMPETVKRLKQRADSAPTEYIRRDFEKALDSYNVRYDYAPYDSWAVQLGFGIISMREADIVLLLLVLAVLSPIFAREKECGMYQLIYTTKGGKSKAFRSKLGAVLLITFAVTLVFSLTIIAVTFARRDIPLSCLSQPVQAFPDLYFCPAFFTFSYKAVRVPAGSFGDVCFLGFCAWQLCSARLFGGCIRSAYRCDRDLAKRRTPALKARSYLTF